MNEKERFDLVVEMGEILMINGGEIQRAEDTMSRVARAFEIEQFSTYVIANGIFSSAVSGGNLYTCKIVCLPIASPFLCRVDAINQLSREIARGACTPEDARRKVAAIRQMPGTGSAARLVFSGLGAACFCYLFGGSPLDSLLSFVAGLLGALYMLFAVPRLHMPKVMVYITASALVTLYTSLVFSLGLGESLDHIIIGSIFQFVPGVPFTTGIRYICDDDYLAGITQLVDAVLIGGSIAIGVGVILLLRGWALGG